MGNVFVFLESMKLSSAVLCGLKAAQCAPSSPSTAPAHAPLCSTDSPQPRSAHSSLCLISSLSPGSWYCYLLVQVFVDEDALLCSSAFGKPRSTSHKRPSTAETTSPPQLHERKRMVEHFPAGYNCPPGAKITCQVFCVCVRSCSTLSREESVSGVVAWTWGFAERSPETWLFRGLNFFWYITNKVTGPPCCLCDLTWNKAICVFDGIVFS